MVIYDRGSSYKSKGERQIADFLASRDIAFQYEYPLAIMDRGQVRIWYPDFRLPDYGTIIEYFGMSGNPTYNEQMARKIYTYRESGIDGIYLTESSFRGDWQRWILDRIEQILVGRLRRISMVNRAEYPAPVRT